MSLKVTHVCNVCLTEWDTYWFDTVCPTCLKEDSKMIFNKSTEGENMQTFAEKMRDLTIDTKKKAFECELKRIKEEIELNAVGKEFDMIYEIVEEVPEILAWLKKEGFYVESAAAGPREENVFKISWGELNNK